MQTVGPVDPGLVFAWMAAFIIGVFVVLPQLLSGLKGYNTALSFSMLGLMCAIVLLFSASVLLTELLVGNFGQYLRQQEPNSALVYGVNLVVSVPLAIILAHLAIKSMPRERITHA